MKVLTRHTFDGDHCRKQLHEFWLLLESNTSLDEQKDILPFFKVRHDISLLISEYSPDIRSPDVIAREYPIYGHFRADLLIGNSVPHQYPLVEFENGTADGIFRKSGNKAALEWRMDRVGVDSHKLSCLTFDQLREDLNFLLSKLYGK